ncbi:YihY family inner membrane protein [Parasutterella muris]|uniref:YihY family inner membrane protein n=1 Tax=Parasutterella muris TaxID=2565572 RepID=UPI00203E8805|nr:YihY family inner membrane protein [Parasutterella muris]
MSQKMPAIIASRPWCEKLWTFGSFVFTRIDKASLKQVASSLTLTTLLSIVPALAVIMAAFSAFPLFAPYREAFENFMFSTLLPEQYSTQILGYIKQFASQAAGLTAFGIIGLAVSALLCISTIDAALNSTFEVRKLRSVWQRVLIYWALLSLGPIAIGVSLATSSYLTGMAMTGHLSSVASWLIPIFQLLFQAVILAMFYKYVPNCKVQWKDALVGGLIIALVFTVFRWAFGIYVMKGSYTTIYGAFAAIPVLLTWMYINWMFVLAGAAITAILPMLRATRFKDFDKPGNQLLSAVALLRILMKAKQDNRPQMSSIELAEAIGSYPDAVNATLSRLISTNYVVQIGTDSGCSWALLADAHSKTLEEAFEEFSVDLSNSLLKEGSPIAQWLNAGLKDQWLQTPMIEVLN